MADILRYAVVTGAAGGIGRAMVAAFEAAGVRVLATDRGPAPADLPCWRYLPVDLDQTVRNEAMAREVFDRIHQEVGSGALVALVNNAATQVLGSTAELTRDDWQRTLSVNLLAPFLWAQGLLGALEKGRGCVVNISSIHARLTKPGFVAYATSKGALSAMTRAMAVDLRGKVRVNAIEPAAIGTDMLHAGFAAHPDKLDALAGHHPIGRIGRPGEVAALALALIEGGLEFVHGATIALDGGIGSSLSDPDSAPNSIS